MLRRFLVGLALILAFPFPPPLRNAASRFSISFCKAHSRKSIASSNVISSAAAPGAETPVSAIRRAMAGLPWRRYRRLRCGAVLSQYQLQRSSGRARQARAHIFAAEQEAAERAHREQRRLEAVERERQELERQRAEAAGNGSARSKLSRSGETPRLGCVVLREQQNCIQRDCLPMALGRHRTDGRRILAISVMLLRTFLPPDRLKLAWAWMAGFFAPAAGSKRAAQRNSRRRPPTPAGHGTAAADCHAGRTARYGRGDRRAGTGACLYRGGARGGSAGARRQRRAQAPAQHAGACRQAARPCRASSIRTPSSKATKRRCRLPLQHQRAQGRSPAARRHDASGLRPQARDPGAGRGHDSSIPTTPRAFYVLGLTHAANMNKAKAVAAFEQAVALDPKNIAYRKELNRAQSLSGARDRRLQAPRAPARRCSMPAAVNAGIAGTSSPSSGTSSPSRSGSWSASSACLRLHPFA